MCVSQKGETMKGINVRKLIHQISKYDFLSFGSLVLEAESVVRLEEIEEEVEANKKS